MRYLWLFCLSVSLWGQTFDLSHFQNGSTSLAGQWKFHPGDDPRWADPNFDDSDWKLVPVPLRLHQQGDPNFSGYGWYRITLQRSSQDAPSDLSLAVMAVTNVAVFYANGASVGRFGEFPPHPRVYVPRPLSFHIPPERWHGNRLLVAIRIWVRRGSTFSKPSGPIDNPQAGPPTVIDNLMAAHQLAREHSQLPGNLVKCAELVLAFYLLGLYFTESRRPEYLWLGICFVADVIYWVNIVISDSTFLLTAHSIFLFQWLLYPVLFTTSLLGIWTTCEERIGPLLKILMTAIFLDTLIRIVLLEGGFPSLERYFVVSATLSFLAVGVLLLFVLRQAWSKTGEIHWFALSFIPFFAVTLARNMPLVARHINPELSNLLWFTMFGLTVLGVGFVLIRRSGRLRSERDRLHAEMLAAQQIQKLLLPAQAITIPGLQVDAVYVPAQEVGGDFFQVAKTRDDSLLLIMGDVSGKGLKAALTVSLIVGLWQEMIDGSEQSPQAILSRLNAQLLRRLPEGFVTCLCVRLSADGALTVANAGHLAPYVNGQELVTDNGLPLGLSAEVEYSETQHILAPGDRLTLVSDGVVEARDSKRNLYGFERLQQVLSEPLGADAIARRAQQFGQEDDITVISITRKAVAVQPLPQVQAASIVF